MTSERQNRKVKLDMEAWNTDLHGENGHEDDENNNNNIIIIN